MKENILVVGLGSIGTRHVTNLETLGYLNINIVNRTGETVKGFERFKFYPSINNACSEKNFDAVIIATPTANHITNLLEALDNNIENIYLEKPISHSLDNLEKIEKLIEDRKVNLVVGYDLHFDPGLALTKHYIETGKIGKVLSFVVEVGQYLPDWRPEVDYRKTMSAHKSKGGGVMLDLIHEFDYVDWLVGPVKSIAGRKGRISNLDINTEDVSVNLIETCAGALGTIHLDYLQFELCRTCKIIGNYGVVVWDYGSSVVKFMSHQDKSWVISDFSSYERNDRFIDVLRAFMNSCSGKTDKRLVSFSSAIRSLKLVIFSKNSSNKTFMEKV